MNKQVFLIVLILLLACCKNKKNEFVFNIFDPTEISDFTYEYENGKIISETTLQSVFILGNVVDKNIFRSFYKYNDKGLLEQKTTYFNENSNPNLDIYIYNSNDLLIKEFGIMGRDTVTWYEYDYFPDGKKFVFFRDLLVKSSDLNPDLMDDLTEMSKRSDSCAYDTIRYQCEYVYENAFCKMDKQYNSDNQLDKIVEYEYDMEGRMIKRTHYTYSGSLKILEMTYFYDYSKSSNKPDCFCSGINENDTVSMEINEFQDDKLIITTNRFERGNYEEKLYYQNEKMVNRTFLDKESNYYSKEAYFYYPDGELKQVRKNAKY